MDEERIILRLFKERVDDLDAFAEGLHAFFARYGFGANAIFIGPDHWLAQNKISMIHGMDVVIIEGNSALVGLRLRGDRRKHTPGRWAYPERRK